MFCLLVALVMHSSVNVPQEKYTWFPYPIGNGFTARFPSKPKKVSPVSSEVETVKEVWEWHKPGLTLRAQIGKIKGKDFQGFGPWQGACVTELCHENLDLLTKETESLSDGVPVLEATATENGVTRSIYDLNTGYYDYMLETSYGGAKPPEVDQFLQSLIPPMDFASGFLRSAALELKAYKLGKSGISAKFPFPPKLESIASASSNNKVGSNAHLASFSRALRTDFTIYGAVYCDRIFVVQYMDIPRKHVGEYSTSQILKEVAEYATYNFDEAPLRTTPGVLGTDPALWGGLVYGHSATVELVVVLHRNRAIVALAMGPKMFKECPAYREFLHSIKFSD